MKYLILALPVCLVVLFALSGCSNKAPGNIGVKDGHLSPCPETPNCVSSEAIDNDHKVDPIKAHGTPEIVMVDLTNVIESMFGGKVVRLEGNYLHAEFTSRIFRFVDDLECLYDEKNGLIQVRSASRIGYSDLNANRKRIEELRKRYMALQ